MILGYTRVSTEEQASHGTTSLASQEKKCRALAAMRDCGPYDFVLFSDPGVSGSIPLNQRPAGAKLLEMAKAGDTIVVAKLDRIFRSATDALVTVEELAKRKIDLVLIDMGTEPVTANGVSKLFFQMLAAFAEFERGRIAERMRDGRTAKRERSGHLGGSAPYGFRVVGEGREAKLEQIPEEIETLKYIAHMKKKRAPSTIRRGLSARNIVDRTGKPFTFTQIRRLMRRADITLAQIGITECMQAT